MSKINIVGNNVGLMSCDELSSGEHYVCTTEGPYNGWILRAIRFDTIYGVWICNNSAKNQPCAVLAKATVVKEELRFRPIDAEYNFYL